MPEWTADTNIRLRRGDPAHEMFPVATRAVEGSLTSDEIYLLPQIVTEFWRVATAAASQRGGFGWDTAKADLKVQQQVYDARIVAAMLADNITHLITFNKDGFQRDTAWGITAVHPDEM